jgi:hypothetical protein
LADLWDRAEEIVNGRVVTKVVDEMRTYLQEH